MYETRKYARAMICPMQKPNVMMYDCRYSAAQMVPIIEPKYAIVKGILSFVSRCSMNFLWPLSTEKLPMKHKDPAVNRSENF